MNVEAIRINQEWAGEPGHLFAQSAETTPMWCFQPRRSGNSTCKFATTQVWKKQLGGGQVAVLLVNNGDGPNDVAVDFAQLGLACGSGDGGCTVRDVWGGHNTTWVGGKNWTAAQLRAHDSQLLRVFPPPSKEDEDTPRRR